MAKDRVAIPDDLAAKVMFASDRTCCVCRSEKHKVQIHHIDGDPSNNSFENLAVICLFCHSDAHTTGVFVRNLTPQLIQLYNSSWRDIVRLRLNPPTEGADKIELAAEAFLQARLDCRSWVNTLYWLSGHPDSPFSMGFDCDVPERGAETWLPEYSEGAYRRLSPLFEEGVPDLQRRFDRLSQLMSDVLAPSFHAMLLRANRRLSLERIAYRRVPLLNVASADMVQDYFRARFMEILRVLNEVANEADQRRLALFVKD